MQTDPIGYGDGMNWYAYVGNDPVNAKDPSGLRQFSHNGQDCTYSHWVGYYSNPESPRYGEIAWDNGPQVMCTGSSMGNFDASIYYGEGGGGGGGNKKPETPKSTCSTKQMKQRGNALDASRNDLPWELNHNQTDAQYSENLDFQLGFRSAHVKSEPYGKAALFMFSLPFGYVAAVEASGMLRTLKLLSDSDTARILGGLGAQEYAKGKIFGDAKNTLIAVQTAALAWECGIR